MKIKIFKRSRAVKNLILFLLNVPFFWHLQHSFFYDNSFLNSFNAQIFFDEHRIGLLFIVVTIICLWKQWKWSPYIFMLFIVFHLYKVYPFFYPSFNKLIFFMNFIFAAISYYLYLVLKESLNKACYNPLIYKYDLLNNEPYGIKAKISDLSGVLISEGELVNWDLDGFFIKFNVSPRKLPKKIQLSIYFRQKEFVHEGDVVSAIPNNGGIGIQINHNFQKADKTRRFNWEELYSILKNMGFIPEVFY